MAGRCRPSWNWGWPSADPFSSARPPERADRPFLAALDIAQKVERIAQGSEENSAAVAQTAASAQRLEQLANELNALASRFRIA